MPGGSTPPLTGSSRAENLMLGFAERTGLAPPGAAPRRYLWTDAFAVCNFLGLSRKGADSGLLNLALDLVDQVHNTLGRHRGGDGRRGWLSGLSEGEGSRHPTLAGLRIGKALNERGPDEPYDERLEWDRDGQYYHYLTKWMHALDCVSRATGDGKFHAWAVELARAAHAAFTYEPAPGAPRRMFWKMSIDLSRPLVAYMGMHDPLDGLVTYCELQAGKASGASGGPDLSGEIADMARICREQSLATGDPLGIGGLLFDAFRIGHLAARGAFPEPGLLHGVLDAALAGIETYADSNALELPVDYRLGFRELGLAIGLKAVDGIQAVLEGHPEAFAARGELLARLSALGRYASLGEAIEGFWLAGENQQAPTWTEHRDINEVMLATTLAPQGFLTV